MSARVLRTPAENTLLSAGKCKPGSRRQAMSGHLPLIWLRTGRVGPVK